MPIKREELLQKLEMVAPALCDHDLIPLLTSVLFTGTHLVAFNDRIGISTSLKTDFKGTIPGKTLIDTLKIVSHAQQIEITSVDNRARLIAGKTKIVLDSRPQSEYTAIFEIPKRPKDMAPVDEKFFSAIEDCLQSTSDHATIPDHLGITIIPSKNGIKLFGTNAITISYSKITLSTTSGVKQRVILPAAFCREILRLGKQAENSAFILRNDHALFVTDKAMLFGRLVQTDKPLDLEGVLQKHMPSKGQVPIQLTEAQRPRLKSALELAARICDIKGNEVKTRVRCQKGVMEFLSSSTRGEATDHVNVKHANFDVLLQASHLRDVYDRYEDILITEKSVLLSRDNLNSIFLLATYTPRE